MKRTKPQRLLTPQQMVELQDFVYERDGGCLMAAMNKGHTCGGRGHSGKDGVFEAHHVVEQSWIKDEYAKRGGIYLKEDPPRVRPITRFEFIDPEITADEIARDPDICVCLCGWAHDLWDHLPSSKKAELLGPQRRVVLEAARFYTLDSRLERAYGTSFMEELEKGSND